MVLVALEYKMSLNTMNILQILTNYLLNIKADGKVRFCLDRRGPNHVQKLYQKQLNAS